MLFEQVRFLGSSITSFTANLGWGTQESRLQVNLVDDVRYGDCFIPPDVGAPINFNYLGWQFAGLLERYGIGRGFNGNPIYNISLVDPRVLLDGVQIILSDYYGQTDGIPNLLNIFGYLENSVGFGGSGKNESGIEWYRIKNAIMDLTLTETSSDYGGPISYKGFRYNISLLGLPNLPSYYRVAATPNMSLLEFINEICDAGASEYFITLQGTTIVVNTISRANIPLKGTITQFVEKTDGAVALSSGLEMINEVNQKFLIGGQKTDVYFSFYGTGPDENILSSKDNPIWYYWGKDNDGNLITSDGPYQDFYLDARGVLIQNVNDVYRTDINEMRAALASQDSWETYLWFNCFNRFIFDPKGTEQDNMFKIDEKNNFVEDKTIKYKHNGYKNPHFGKAYYIGIGFRMDQNIVAFLMGKTANEILNTTNLRFILQAAQREALNLKEQEDDMSKLYGLVQSYADEYYGRKFMVLLPNVYVTRDEETLELFFSHNTTDSGFLSEDIWATAVQNNLMPPFVNAVTTVDGRVSAYVRFDNIQNLDLSGIAPEDLLFGIELFKNSTSSGYRGTKSVFVRCSVEDELVFLDKDNFTSPRAVISLNSRVYVRNPERYGEKVIVDWLNTIQKSKITNPWTDTDLSNIKGKLLSGVNGDIFNTFSYPLPIIPNMAAVPIKSNIDTYGPWYSASGNGKIEVEHSEDLVPWNYDGYDGMNQTAQARVNMAVGNLQWLESGTVEFPGIPLNQLGVQLLGSGPYITDISVNIGEGGVTTTYSMRSWNPQFGKTSKQFLDKIHKSQKLSQQIRRNMREQLTLNTFKKVFLNTKTQIPTIQ